MFRSQLDKFPRETRQAIVTSLNQLGVCHSIKDFVLTVTDEDEELVKRIIVKLTEGVHSSSLDIDAQVAGTTIRYDISELDDLVITALIFDLKIDQIQFTLNDKILTVPKTQESRVDAHIARNEAAVNEIETIQESARREKLGYQSPRCEICGEQPAASINLRRQVGMVVLMRQYSATALLCESCARTAYAEFQKSTALKGWIGVKSALMNPIIIGTNALSKRRHKDKIRRFKGGI